MCECVCVCFLKKSDLQLSDHRTILNCIACVCVFTILMREAGGEIKPGLKCRSIFFKNRHHKLTQH